MKKEDNYFTVRIFPVRIFSCIFPISKRLLYQNNDLQTKNSRSVLSSVRFIFIKAIWYYCRIAKTGFFQIQLIGKKSRFFLWYGIYRINEKRERNENEDWQHVTQFSLGHKKLNPTLAAFAKGADFLFIAYMYKFHCSKRKWYLVYRWNGLGMINFINSKKSLHLLYLNEKYFHL